ncbi:PREDICTED: uncharacterized protein LOC109341236 [Lupinus angustifolius]|uniref:uncharacterized protein LOC109341236 n=1 Tax=Lupinus angustifolius TaxID=3871 RepID=UPI00092E80FF|nr:PREDICTED: uncharacterized protein LOC109341236 [Lupinus angustifolius]
MSRSIRQGDPLSPFLFLIVVEGLIGLMKSAVTNHKFEEYEFGKNKVGVNLLQYADDAVIIGKSYVHNVIAMKYILRPFEACSGLKVNFGKCNLSGVNIHPSFLDDKAGLLNCKRGLWPMKFLGIPVGSNHRRKEVWKDMLSNMSKRWMMLSERVSLLSKVLESKYGAQSGFEWGEVGSRGSLEFLWWRELKRVMGGAVRVQGGFIGGFKKVVGNGRHTRFWEDFSVGEGSLKEYFERMYNLSSSKGVLLGHLGYWRDGLW